MTFTTALGVLGRRWRTLVLGAVVGLLVAGVVGAVTPHRYVAEAAVHVSGLDTPPTAGADVVAYTLLLEQRVTTYRDLMVSGDVLGTVGQRTGLPVTRDDVAVRPGKASSVFGVVAVADDPRTAATVAAAVADRFAEVLADVDRPVGPGAVPNARATVVDRPTGATDATSGLGSDLLLGLLAGLGAAAVWVLLRDVTSRKRRGPNAHREVDGRSGAPMTPVAAERGSGDDAT